MILTTTSKTALANFWLDKVDSARVILLGEMTKEIKRDIFKYDEYDTDSITDIKQFELPELKGYTTEGLPVSGIAVVVDEDTNKVVLSASNVVFYNNPLEPNEFKIYGFALIDITTNTVFSTEILQSPVEIIRDDFHVIWPTTKMNDTIVSYLAIIQ